MLLAELGQTFQVVTLSNQATELPAGTAVVGVGNGANAGIEGSAANAKAAELVHRTARAGRGA